MAWRNLVTRGGFGLSFMTVISIFGVTVGVGTLIIVLSVMGGFEQSLRKKMLSGEPHVEVVSQQSGAGFSLNEFSRERFAKLVPEAEHLEAFTQADVVLKHRKHLQSAVLLGIDANLDKHLWLLTEKMLEGQLSTITLSHRPVLSEKEGEHRWPGIVLGEGLAGNLGVDIGDEISIINPLSATDPSSAMAGDTTVRNYVVVGFFQTSDFNYDNKWAVVTIEEGRKFMPQYDYTLDEDRYVSGMAMNLKDAYDAPVVKKRLEALKELNTVTWQDSNKSLLFALKLEKFAMGSILMLIVVVAAFSISGTMMMTVFHKRTQVALLRAVGMTRSGIAKLYLTHGFTIGTVGILLGLGFGLLVCLGLHQFELIPLPQGVYYLKRLPVKFVPNIYVVVCLSAWLLTIVASLYPALTAAAQSPSAGLRQE